MQQAAPDFSQHLESRIILMKENFATSKLPGYPSLNTWTNNNCESLNNVFKMAINCQPRALAELVDKLYQVVRGQYKELECALVGAGNFKLCPELNTFAVDSDLWSTKQPDQRSRHFQRFFGTRWKIDQKKCWFLSYRNMSFPVPAFTLMVGGPMTN